MKNIIPTRVFLTKGVGRSKYLLKSFEAALQKAGVVQQNLVEVSSILPPHCKIISREVGLRRLIPGSISFSVIARCDTNEYGRQIAVSVGIAMPKDEDRWGYISEVHSYGMAAKQSADMAKDLARPQCWAPLSGSRSTPIAPGPRRNKYTSLAV